MSPYLAVIIATLLTFGVTATVSIYLTARQVRGQERERMNNYVLAIAFDLKYGLPIITPAEGSTPLQGAIQCEFDRQFVLESLGTTGKSVMVSPELQSFFFKLTSWGVWSTFAGHFNRGLDRRDIITLMEAERERTENPTPTLATAVDNADSALVVEHSVS